MLQSLKFKIRPLFKHRVKIALLIMVAMVMVASPVVDAITGEERQKNTRRDILFLDDPCSSPQGNYTSIITNDTEIAYAKIIMGIAKTYNLGKQGALIGLMTAITESSLQNYASAKIPESELNPAWLALPEPRPKGNDYDSLGIMQQRAGMDMGDKGISVWSTYGAYHTANAENRKLITNQLMDPAYAAQAFFGTPSGAQLPEGLPNPAALKKGLQNRVPNWQTMDPGAAAQAVQGSAFPDRYNEHKDEAIAFLNQYWNQAPPVQLPISVTGGVAANPDNSANSSCLGVGTSKVDLIVDKILEYAWPTYCSSSRGSCEGFVSEKLGDYATPTSRTKTYTTATNLAKDRGEYIGSCNGVDCGAFVTRVMRDSGADPNYNNWQTPGHQQGNTTQQLEYLRRMTQEGKYQRVMSERELQTGDIAIRSSQTFPGLAGHTFFYVGSIKYPDGTEFGGDAASASQCDRAPMAGPNDDFGEYEWYRLVQ